MKQYQIRYFASLREQAGRSEEAYTSAASTPAALYHELQARYGFSLELAQLKVAVDDAFVATDLPLGGGERLVFVPPVSGG